MRQFAFLDDDFTLSSYYSVFSLSLSLYFSLPLSLSLALHVYAGDFIKTNYMSCILIRGSNLGWGQSTLLFFLPRAASVGALLSHQPQPPGPTTDHGPTAGPAPPRQLRRALDTLTARRVCRSSSCAASAGGSGRSVGQIASESWCHRVRYKFIIRYSRSLGFRHSESLRKIVVHT